MSSIRLGINIDHIATLRNARGGMHPSPLAGAMAAIQAGAHGITAHLREDRRHVKDSDLKAIKANISVPLNFEMAATDEMVSIAMQTRPNACCLVPENRAEVTTEGGLNLLGDTATLSGHIASIKAFGARVSLFIDPTEQAVNAAHRLGADIVELHTGELAHAYAANPDGDAVTTQFNRIKTASSLATSLGIEVHAGHGLNYQTAELVASVPEMVELNIGHFLIGEAVFVGIDCAVKRMLAAMERGVAKRPL